MARQILLIDDSAMLRRIAASALGSTPGHYEVVSATRASEGFARACGGEAAVILLDEHLAKLDGADLCRRLSDEPRTSRVPVILMTGRKADGPALSALPPNVVEILSKPFAPEELVGAVNSIVSATRRDPDLAAIRRALHPGQGKPGAAAFTDQPLSADDAVPPEPPVATAPPTFKPGETASIRSAMHAVTARGLTGALQFCPVGQLPTEVFVDGGRLVLVTTHDGAAYAQEAAEFLPSKVSPATLQDAAAEQNRTGKPFLLTLGARGLVSKAAGVEMLQRFGQRHFSRLWTVPAKSLQITFEPLESLPGYALRLEPAREPLDQWLLESLRTLRAEDFAAEARHQGLVGTPVLLRRVEPVLKVLDLTEAESAFLRQVDGRHDLPVISRALGITPETAFGFIHRFCRLEILTYRPAPVPFVVTPRTSRPRRVLPLKR